MKTGMFALTLGLGAAVGAVAVMMMPRQNPTRKFVQKAADNVEDIVSEAAEKIGM